MPATRTLTQAVEFGRTAGEYQRLRQAHPTVPAQRVFAYVRDDDCGMSFEQFNCHHEWPPLEGRGALLCYLCGLDGDS